MTEGGYLDRGWLPSQRVVTLTKRVVTLTEGGYPDKEGGYLDRGRLL